MIDIETKKNIISNWFVYLQNQISEQFEYLEKKISSQKPKKFRKRIWSKENKEEGGGTSLLLENGNIFDKVGINISKVSGTFDRSFKNKILGAEKDGKYWASGISIVAHMKNPKIPAIHFNTRYIVTSKEWFGGGIDLTPCLNDKKESIFFILS